MQSNQLFLLEYRHNLFESYKLITKGSTLEIAQFNYQNKLHFMLHILETCLFFYHSHQLTVWGNQCDLSLSGGVVMAAGEEDLSSDIDTNTTTKSALEKTIEDYKSLTLHDDLCSKESSDPCDAGEPGPNSSSKKSDSDSDKENNLKACIDSVAILKRLQSSKENFLVNDGLAVAKYLRKHSDNDRPLGECA